MIMIFVISSNCIQIDYKELSDKDIWLNLSPELHIYDNDYLKKTEIINISMKNRTDIRDSMIVDGYIKLDPLFDLNLMNKMKELVNKLDELELPLVFSFVYDEFWLLFMKLHQIIATILDDDYYRLPDFWSWKIHTANEETGWSIHRDWGHPSIFEDGMPETITLWIPLNDVDCTNSCMYIIPASEDPTYYTFDDIKNTKYWPKMLKNVRALPVKTGSVIIWNQNVWHWGSKTSSSPFVESRISLAFAFQVRRTKSHNTPVSDPLLLLPFKDRIAIIAKQIIQYQHMYSLESDIKNLAEEITKESEILETNEFKDGLKYEL